MGGRRWELIADRGEGRKEIWRWEEKGLMVREESRSGDGSSSELEMGGDCRCTDGLSVRRRRENWRWKQLETGDETDGEEKEEVGGDKREAGGGEIWGQRPAFRRWEAGGEATGGEQEDDGRRKEEKARLGFVRRLRNGVMRSRLTA
ncbi:hypothetical protein ACLOJK_023443 [Asimina triloba]